MLHLKQNIATLRSLTGLSQASFGEVFGLTKDMIYSYEKGKAEPSEATIAAMASVLGVTTEEFKGGKLRAERFSPVEVGKKVIGSSKSPKNSDKDDLKDKYIALLESQVSLATGELRHIAVMNFSMLKTMRMSVARLLAKAEKEDLMTIAGRLDRETASFYKSVRERGSLIDLDI